jgi:hypothetical protein
VTHGRLDYENQTVRIPRAGIPLKFQRATLNLPRQGSLTPPGAPAPTMKSLAQIEPRTPISSVPYTISSPGSYYLTTNLTSGSFQAGIAILADNVTLDLSGFALIGVPNSFSGIYCFGQKNVCIRNGTIRGWDNDGIDAFPSSNQRYEKLFITDNTTGGWLADKNALVADCVVSSNSGGGILVGDGSSVSRCLAQTNFGAGIVTGHACAVEECTAVSNTGMGISADAGSTLRGCAARLNGSDGINVQSGSVVKDCASGNSTGNEIYAGGQCAVLGCSAQNNHVAGIQLGDNATLKDCNSTGNTSDGIHSGKGSTVSGCTANGNPNYGIYALGNSTVNGCTASANGGDGISVADGVTVIGCTADFNGTSFLGKGIGTGARAQVTDCTAVGNSWIGIAVAEDSIVIGNHASANGGTGGADNSGITASGSGSRIEGNQVRDNIGLGINAGAGDIILRISAGNNTTNNYSPSSGANFAPIQSPSTATSPFANIVF